MAEDNKKAKPKSANICPEHSRKVIYYSEEKKPYCKDCLDQFFKDVKDLSDKISILLAKRAEELSKERQAMSTFPI